MASGPTSDPAGVAHPRNRLLLIAGAGAVLLWLLARAWDALLPFAVALVLGYLLAPLVDRLSRWLPRVGAILLIYLVGLGTLVGLGFLLVPAAGHQIRDLVDNTPQYGRQLQALTQDGQAWFDSLDVPPQVRDALSSGIQDTVGGLGTTIQSALVSVVGIATRTVAVVFGLLVIPVWLFYVLKDKDLAAARFYSLFSAAARPDIEQAVGIAGRVLANYVRGQVILGGVVGLATTVGLVVVGAPYWLLLGALYGVTEVVPIVGPLVGAIPGLAVALLTGDWGLALKVLAVYVLVQQLENNLLVPKIQGDQVQMHPALIILAIVIGSQVAGLGGVLIAVPLAAIGRDVYRYLYRRFGIGDPPAVAAQGLGQHARPIRAASPASAEPPLTM